MELSKHDPESSTSASSVDQAELFKLLFKQHASGIYRQAYADLHSRAEAQEIVQECFLKYWEKRDEVSPAPLAIKKYLYTSAYHAILNQLRRQRNWVYHECADDLLVDQEPQLAEMEYDELQLCYTHALAQLPAKRRQIFAMSRQQGLSNALIAQELNLSIKTVEAQMTQAIKFLRQYFIIRGVVPSLLLLLLGLL